MIRCSMQKPISPKSKCYSLHITEPNESLDLFPGSEYSKNMGEADINKIPLHIMPNVWRKHVYLQSFKFDLNFNKAISVFEQTEIAKLIYKVVVVSYKNPTEQAYYNHANISRKQRVEAALPCLDPHNP